MFRGRFDHALDAKGRTSIPLKFREILREHYQDERLMLTGFDACLWAYPPVEWERLEKKIAELPQFKREVKALQRLFLSAGVECPVDKQGRILIPPGLRDYAGIKRDIVIVGVTRRIEVWDKGRWENEIRKAQEDQSIGEVLAGFDI